jgi:phosphatidylserine decarboxylase
MKIHKEGRKVIPPVFIILLIIEVIFNILTGHYLFFYSLTAGLIIILTIVIWFFREPYYKIFKNEKQVLSVSDGEIVVIEPCFEREYFKEERIQVSVFMSVLNVHINHVPVAGEIVYQHHRNGRFLPAFIAKSSEENERSTTVIKMKDGSEILVRQIAGALARRVITYKKTGDMVEQDEQLGFIRFGSRVDLFLPKSAKIEVKLYQKVFGGKSVIATFD